jgi:hypothetical protein
MSHTIIQPPPPPCSVTFWILQVMEWTFLLKWCALHTAHRHARICTDVKGRHFTVTSNHHHHKHPGLGHLARSVSKVKVALSIVSLVSQLFSFRVSCKGKILKGFGFVEFFAGVKASSFFIHLSCLVCSLSVVRGEWSRMFCSHKGRNLPEVSIASFLHYFKLSYKNFR